jgi:hypothetical protein
MTLFWVKFRLDQKCDLPYWEQLVVWMMNRAGQVSRWLAPLFYAIRLFSLPIAWWLVV